MSKTQRALSPSRPKSAKLDKQGKGSGLQGTSTNHVQREDTPWAITIPDHEPRTDSDAYRVARKVMNNVVKEIKEFFLGASGPYQDHHGGGLWAYDASGWFFVRNLAGMEWASQFCADPKKVDVLRQNARRFYAGFPQTFAKLKERRPDVLIIAVDTFFYARMRLLGSLAARHGVRGLRSP